MLWFEYSSGVGVSVILGWAKDGGGPKVGALTYLNESKMAIAKISGTSVNVWERAWRFYFTSLANE